MAGRRLKRFRIYLLRKIRPTIRLNDNTPNCGDLTSDEKRQAYNDKERQIVNYLSTIGINEFKPTEDDEKRICYIEDTSENEEAGYDIHQGKHRIPEFITPRKVVTQMIEMLDDSVWNPNTIFIDLACKGGEYLKVIYDKLMSSERVIREYKDPGQRSIHILQDQIYGIALSQESETRTKTKLLGFYKNDNIKYISELSSKLRNIEDIIKFLKEETGWKNMKFDVVIGNPPYQENTASIYPDFIKLGMKIAPKVCMITRDNWLASDTLNDTRNKMITYGLKEIRDYPVFHELFSGADVAVSIFYMEENYSGDTLYNEIRNGNVSSKYSTALNGLPIIFRSSIEYSIYKKIAPQINKNGSFNIHVLPTEPFRIASNGNAGRGGNTYMLMDYSDKDQNHDVAVAYMQGNGKMYCRYIGVKDVPVRSKLVDTYKVLTGKVLHSNQNVITGLHLLNTRSICSSSWAVLFTGKEQIEVYNASKYIKTRFFRFLVKILCDVGAIGVSPYRFSLVPEQNYTEQSDIPWGDVEYDINVIEKAIYKKYNLTDDEINYIESAIKPME